MTVDVRLQMLKRKRKDLSRCVKDSRMGGLLASRRAACGGSRTVCVLIRMADACGVSLQLFAFACLAR